MSEITLQSLRMENARAVVRLKVAPEQRGYMASNADSIAEAYVEPVMQPRAIYADDELVGFAMYGYGDDTTPAEIRGRWWIIRFMVDEHFQRRGYGRTAMLKLIELIREQPDCKSIFLGVDPANAVAIRLYESLGFQATDEIEYGETIMQLQFDGRKRSEPLTVSS